MSAKKQKKKRVYSFVRNARAYNTAVEIVRPCTGKMGTKTNVESIFSLKARKLLNYRRNIARKMIVSLLSLTPL
jgi:hypothetical protein